MRRRLLLATALLLVAGCGSPSTLSADDQEVCADQEDELVYGREAIDDLIDGDRHWSSKGEPLAVGEVALTPAYHWLTSRTPQDAELAKITDEAGKAVLSVQIYMPDKVFEDDAQVAKDARELLDRLQTFCDENG